jgi:imidazolonepropionase-like amidohydrolase
MPRSSVVRLVTLAVIGFGFVRAQEPGPQPKRRPGGQPPVERKDAPKVEPKSATPKSEPTPAPKNAPPMPKPAAPPAVTAIVGAEIHTVTREVIGSGVILIRDGKIERVGRDVPVPEGALVIDAKGRTVSPGFVSITTSGVGIRGGGGIGGLPFPIPGAAPRGKPEDSLDPYDRNMLFALGHGITSVCSEVGAGGRRGLFSSDAGELDDRKLCPCCNQTIIPREPLVPPIPGTAEPRKQVMFKLTPGELGAMYLGEAPFLVLPPSSLAGSVNRFQFRENIRRARKYIADQAEHEKKVAAGERTPPPPRTVSDDFLKLAKKEVVLRTEASSVDQIRDMIALAKETDIRIVLEDVLEGWLIPDEIARARIPTIITPRTRRFPQPGRPDDTGSSIELAGILERAGVPFTVQALSSSVSLDGVPGRCLMSLPLEAAFAVRGGARESAALAALTIEPARLMGIDARVGSIEEGKDADLLILNGSPLDYRTYVEQAIVAGKVRYDRSKDAILPNFPRN